MEDLDGTKHDLLRSEGTSALDSENEASIILGNHDRLGWQGDFGRVPGALLAERAIVNVLNLNRLLQLIDGEDFARALVDKSAFLLE